MSLTAAPEEPAPATRKPIARWLVLLGVAATLAVLAFRQWWQAMLRAHRSTASDTFFRPRPAAAARFGEARNVDESVRRRNAAPAAKKTP